MTDCDVDFLIEMNIIWLLQMLMQLSAYSYSPKEFLNETLEYVVYFWPK